MLMIMTSVSGTRSLPSIAVERVMTMSAISDISLFGRSRKGARSCCLAGHRVSNKELH